jgi:metallo-beta-lactamase class B
VFDNLYFVGQTEYSAWAVTTSAGIILIDTIFDYSVEDEIVAGLKKLGLDPSTIKYAIVSHGHFDHSGGARYLQERFGTRVILSAADWDLLERSSQTKPKRDMVATDGQKLTLGDTTLTLYVTPGHDLDADSCQGCGDAASRGGVGWHRIQLDAEPSGLHYAGPVR